MTIVVMAIIMVVVVEMVMVVVMRVTVVRGSGRQTNNVDIVYIVDIVIWI